MNFLMYIFAYLLFSTLCTKQVIYFCAIFLINLQFVQKKRSLCVNPHGCKTSVKILLSNTKGGESGETSGSY